jgi:hypothetical protein
MSQVLPELSADVTGYDQPEPHLARLVRFLAFGLAVNTF